MKGLYGDFDIAALSVLSQFLNGVKRVLLKRTLFYHS